MVFYSFVPKMNGSNDNKVSNIEKLMNISDTKVGRRSFIKTSCFAGALVAANPLLKSFRLKCCNYCHIELSESISVSSLGNCRNCGANLITGKLDMPVSLISESSQKNLYTFDRFAEIPFPHPDIQHLTSKPCASAIELKSGVSQIRARTNKIRA